MWGALVLPHESWIGATPRASSRNRSYAGKSTKLPNAQIQQSQTENNAQNARRESSRTHVAQSHAFIATFGAHAAKHHTVVNCYGRKHERANSSQQPTTCRSSARRFRGSPGATRCVAPLGREGTWRLSERTFYESDCQGRFSSLLKAFRSYPLQSVSSDRNAAIVRTRGWAEQSYAADSSSVPPLIHSETISSAPAITF